MKKILRTRWFLLTLLSCFALLLSQARTASTPASAAPADTVPTLSVSDSSVSVSALDSLGCIHETLSGTGFTYDIYLNGNDFMYTQSSGGAQPVVLSTANPRHDANGNFSIPLVICSIAGPGDIYLYAGPARVMRPSPPIAQTVIHFAQSSSSTTLLAISSSLPVAFGCATVGLTGLGFVPSTLSATSYVVLVPSIGYLPSGLGYTTPSGATGYRVSVSGFGTLIASFPVCGVQAGETLAISAIQLQPDAPAAPVMFHIVAFS